MPSTGSGLPNARSKSVRGARMSAQARLMIGPRHKYAREIFGREELCLKRSALRANGINLQEGAGESSRVKKTSKFFHEALGHDGGNTPAPRLRIRFFL